MTLFDAISTAIQKIVITAIGCILGVLILIMLASGFIDKAFGNVIDMLEQASDGVAWEGQPLPTSQSYSLPPW